MRFKIRTLLACFLALSLLLAAVVANVENARLRRSNEKLASELHQIRKDFGIIAPEIDANFNVIAVPCLDRYTWKWRVSAPPGTTIKAGIATSNVTKTGVPPGATYEFDLPEPASGVLITARLQSRLTGGYEFQVKIGGLSQGKRIGATAEGWVDSGGSTEVCGIDRISKTKIGQPVVLLRQRKSEVLESWTTDGGIEGSTIGIPDNAKGVLLWVVPI